jgi:hypothetical protein
MRSCSLGEAIELTVVVMACHDELCWRSPWMFCSSLSLPALVRIEAHDPVISPPRDGRCLAVPNCKGLGLSGVNDRLF